jgi:1-acyl-sn-glycerol-3-phosphate acyltransferase
MRAIARLAVFMTEAAVAAAALIVLPRNRRDLAARARWLQRTCARALRTLRVRCAATGRPPVGSVIVANHLGYLDILVLAAQAPMVFVAKREVRSWPLFGWFARAAGTRFIDREKRADVVRVAQELAEPLAQGVNVVLFLEGTSTDGVTVRPFKSSLLEPAVQHGWQVTPAALGYAVPDGRSVRDEVCWWGEMTLLPHVLNLLSLPRIEAAISWGEPILAIGDRKELATALHARVMGLQAALQQPRDASARSGADAAELAPAVS